MISKLQRFQIVGLHGWKTVDVHFENNTLVLVGENGTGKTTFLRLLFNFLSGRWLSLVHFAFERLIATIDGTEFAVTRDEVVSKFRRVDRRALASIPPALRRRVLTFVERGEIDRAMNEAIQY